jgi:flavin reductase (DIM6/NTAB) family NADH-FMN oxidoreductase RutF
MIIDISSIALAERQAWLQHAIAPRPIAFASTIDAAGNVNLSPFSFFNLFSTHPPIIIFAASVKRDKTFKHTLLNVMEVPEVVINICDDAMVQQMSLSSCEFQKNVDEFIKSGFTKETATLVKPPMVKEAKIKFECRVKEIKSLGDEAGAGKLVIAEVINMHVDESILNKDKTMIDPLKFNFIARMGGDWYTRVNENTLFQVAKPGTQLSIGVDALPAGIRNSSILTGNHLGFLAGVHEMPNIDPAFEDERLKNIIQYFSVSEVEMEKELHLYAKELLDKGKLNEAWQVLLSGYNE